MLSISNDTTYKGLPIILEFMQTVFKMIVKWIEIFPPIFESITNQDNNYHTIHL
jgi:hypothetical protein